MDRCRLSQAYQAGRRFRCNSKPWELQTWTGAVSLKKAVKLWEKAGEGGHAGALNALGMTWFEGGKGYPQDIRLAIDYFVRASDSTYYDGMLYQEKENASDQSDALVVSESDALVLLYARYSNN